MPLRLKLRPSAAAQWFRCSGSVFAQAGLPNESSEYAAEGTVFHSLVADCLRLALEPEFFYGEKRKADGFEFEIGDEMVEHARDGLDRLREIIGKHARIETKVSLDPWLPGESGTVDVGWLDGDTICVWDWKYGAGVPVSPVENEQIMLYALGYWSFIGRPKVRKFNFYIEQPRCAGGGGEWSCSYEDLMIFAGRAKKAGKAALEKNAPRVAGEKQCFFCRAKGKCGEFAAFNLDLMAMKFDDLDALEGPQLPKELTPKRRSYVVQHAKMITSWLEVLHADTLSDAIAGRPTPGLKAIPGRRGKRVWINEEWAEELLIDELGEEDAFAPRKVLSPTQAEKALGKERAGLLDGLTFRGDAKPVLVSEKDARPAIKPISTRFENLDAAESLI